MILELIILVVVAVVGAVLYTPKRKKTAVNYQGSLHRDIVGGGEPRICAAAKNGLYTHIQGFPEIKTMYDNFQSSVKRFPDAKCFGTRKLKNIIKEKKLVNGVQKTWEFFELEPYAWETFTQADKKIKAFASGLRALNISSQQHLGIFEETRVEWTICEQACFSQSIILCTFYATLGEDSVVYAIDEADCIALFTNAKSLPMVLKRIGELKQLKTIIYTDSLADSSVKSSLEEKGLRVVSFEETLKLGEENLVDPVPPVAEDIAVIMYTSGSTGTPKGVIIQHSNLIAAIASIIPSSGISLSTDDIYIAFLPLAHVLALVAENSVLHYGCALGFANARSLTDASVRNCKGDFRELSPTIVCGVPTIWDRIKKGARDKVEKSSPVAKQIFSLAYEMKRKALENDCDTPVLNKIVFDKLRDQLGGRVKVMVSGGAPLSRDTHEFLRICFSIPVLQGYGLTETCGGGSTMNVDADNVYNQAGSPTPAVEIKLVDAPELNYRVTDHPCPRGEVYIRGANVNTRGYWKNEEKTKEDFKPDGWFATGDVGQWAQNGHLEIIDRVKNLVKLSHGEYVALEALETKFKNSQFVENICVYGDSSRDFLVALVVPPKVMLTEWARQEKLPEAEDWSALCKSKAARSHVLKSLVNAGREAGLKTSDLPRAIHLCDEEWTPDNELLTAALKLRRAPVNKKYKAELDALYAEAGSN